MLTQNLQPLPVQGAALIEALVKLPEYTFKAVLNEAGALVFDKAMQHRHMKAPGISYEDDYKGNALAAVVQRGRIEVRYHQDFSDSRTAALIKRLLRQPAFSFAAGFEVLYQGRRLNI